MLENITQMAISEEFAKVIDSFVQRQERLEKVLEIMIDLVKILISNTEDRRKKSNEEDENNEHHGTDNDKRKDKQGEECSSRGRFDLGIVNVIDVKKIGNNYKWIDFEKPNDLNYIAWRQKIMQLLLMYGLGHRFTKFEKPSRSLNIENKNWWELQDTILH